MFIKVAVAFACALIAAGILIYPRPTLLVIIFLWFFVILLGLFAEDDEEEPKE